MTRILKLILAWFAPTGQHDDFLEITPDGPDAATESETPDRQETQR